MGDNRKPFESLDERIRKAQERTEHLMNSNKKGTGNSIGGKSHDMQQNQTEPEVE